jgi:hypothetical protein
MSDWKTELFKAMLMAGIIAYEWYAMQPYHEPMLPRFWLWLSHLCYTTAKWFGSLGMAAENEYYLTVPGGH